MKLRAAAIASLAFALILTGCSGPDDSVTPSDTPPPSSTTPPSSEPEPTTAPEPEELSCEALIKDETLAEFEANGFIFEDDYEAKLRSESSVEAKFFDFDGIACRWYLPNSDVWAAFGYSPISDADSAAIQAELAAAEYTRSVDGTDVIYSLLPDDNQMEHNEWYLFEAGAWYHSIQLAGIQEIRERVAEFEARNR